MHSSGAARRVRAGLPVEPAIVDGDENRLAAGIRAEDELAIVVDPPPSRNGVEAPGFIVCDVTRLQHRVLPRKGLTSNARRLPHVPFSRLAGGGRVA